MECELIILKLLYMHNTGLKQTSKWIVAAAFLDVGEEVIYKLEKKIGI